MVSKSHTRAHFREEILFRHDATHSRNPDAVTACARSMPETHSGENRTPTGGSGDRKGFPRRMSHVAQASKATGFIDVSRLTFQGDRFPGGRLRRNFVLRSVTPARSVNARYVLRPAHTAIAGRAGTSAGNVFMCIFSCPVKIPERRGKSRIGFGHPKMAKLRWERPRELAATCVQKLAVTVVTGARIGLAGSDSHVGESLGDSMGSPRVSERRGHVVVWPAG